MSVRHSTHAEPAGVYTRPASIERLPRGDYLAADASHGGVVCDVFRALSDMGGLRSLHLHQSRLPSMLAPSSWHDASHRAPFPEPRTSLHSCKGFRTLCSN